MYTVSFELPAFILSLFALVYCLTARRRQYHLPRGFLPKLQNQHSVFILILLSNLLAAASSIGCVWLQRRAMDDTATLEYWLNVSYFFFHTMLSTGFALYILNVNRTSVGRPLRFWMFFFLPFVFSEAIILTNSFTGLAFYFDAQHVYHRGMLMPLLYAIGAVYIIMGFVFFFRYKKAISTEDSIAIGVVIILAMLGTVVQAIRPDLLVELFFEALAFHVLLMLLEEHAGHLDAVTGALNRLAFSDINHRLMETGQNYRIVLVTLTNLELYTSLFNGREIDELLMKVSSYLSSISPAQDLYCYRTGRFAIISREPSGADAERLAGTILERFGSDWTNRSLSLHLDAAVCVVRVPEDVTDPQQLAQLLSYDMKEGAGSRRIPFAALDAFRQESAMENALRQAVEENRLRVWYQPIWSASQKRTVAAEALLRVDDPTLIELSPEVYIPIAERSGLIREIGLFVFEASCRFLRDSAQYTPKLEFVELNLSVYQFLYDDLPERFEEIRSRYGVAASRINLELTETASERGSVVVSECMKRLRELGYSFSLDDFGTGFSNLQRLVKGGYANIKIDKSLLWDAGESDASARLLDSLIRAIHRFDVQVIQEGVETQAQLQRVIDAGCDLIQGFLFSRPVPEAEFLQYLTSESAH